ncbi:unnamed protein product, partial [Prorocentrum cordatum]
MAPKNPRPSNAQRDTAAVYGGSGAKERHPFAQTEVTENWLRYFFVVVRVARIARRMCARRRVSYGFIGYDMHSGNPRQGVEWCFQLIALRDGAVDGHIGKNKPKRRGKLCLAARVPTHAEITHPAFHSMGRGFGPRTMLAKATPNKGEQLHIKFTEDNINYSAH